MCGRYTLASDGATLLDEFGLSELARWSPRYNVAPSQNVPIITSENNELHATQVHWGLVPGWSKDRKIGSRLINARAETIAEKPSFRTAFRCRRCLVLADGYYEWAKRGDVKQPYYIYPAAHRPFAFAGLWERWTDETDNAYNSCTIITCAANDALKDVHQRMPVVLDRETRNRWLDSTTDTDDLHAMLRPTANGVFRTRTITTHVNSPAHEGPQCIAPLSP